VVKYFQAAASNAHQKGLIGHLGLRAIRRTVHGHGRNMKTGTGAQHPAVNFTAIRHEHLG
jgi:hypothetical protein